MRIEDEISLGDKRQKLKALFIGPYRQPDEWGFLSRSIVSSLLAIEKIDLTTRPIFLAHSTAAPPVVDPGIFKAESNKQKKYDILIQHSLPNLMVADGNSGLNVGIASFETKNNVQWDNHLQLLDKILVFTEAEKKCISEHLQDKVHVIGSVVSEIDASMQPPPNRFSFYVFAGNMETKGGFMPLLQSYLSEFHVNENVSLIVHTQNPHATQELINVTVTALGIYSGRYYPHIHIVAENPSDSLHKQCNCLVDTGVARGFKQEIAKGLLYGRTPIVLKGSGMDEYIDDSNGWVIKSDESILVCPDRPLPNIFTARELGLTPNQFSLRKCMRNAFDSHILYAKKSSKGKGCGELFTIERQANLIEEALCP